MPSLAPLLHPLLPGEAAGTAEGAAGHGLAGLRPHRPGRLRGLRDHLPGNLLRRQEGAAGPRLIISETRSS